MEELAKLRDKLIDGILEKVEVFQSEGDDNTILLSVNFGVKKGSTIENNRMVIKL